MGKDVKEMWRLRWEYLKRSNNYTRYCEVINDSDFVPDDDLLWSYLRSNYRMIGNLYTEDFENWWKNNRRYAVKDEYLSHLRVNGNDVVDYSSLIQEDMIQFCEGYKMPPQVHKFIKDFSERLKNVRWLYLRINLLGANNAEISRQMQEIMKPSRQVLSVNAWGMNRRA